MIFNQIKYNITGEIAEMPIFPCAMRGQLANLTLTLGEDDVTHNITLSAFDYTVPLNDIDGKPECVLTIRTRIDDMITLGWPFLRKYYIVLDDEEQRIRCKKYFNLSHRASLLTVSSYPEGCCRLNGARQRKARVKTSLETVSLWRQERNSSSLKEKWTNLN
jgi:hypothetical protein